MLKDAGLTPHQGHRIDITLVCLRVPTGQCAPGLPFLCLCDSHL